MCFHRMGLLLLLLCLAVLCTGKTVGAVTLCNLVSNLHCNIAKCFCCSARGGVLHRATQSEQLATICTKKALRYSPLARRSRWSVGFTKKSTHARGKLRCKLLEGCYNGVALQVAVKIAQCNRALYPLLSPSRRLLPSSTLS